MRDWPLSFISSSITLHLLVLCILHCLVCFSLVVPPSPRETCQEKQILRSTEGGHASRVLYPDIIFTKWSHSSAAIFSLLCKLKQKSCLCLIKCSTEQCCIYFMTKNLIIRWCKTAQNAASVMIFIPEKHTNRTTRFSAALYKVLTVIVRSWTDYDNMKRPLWKPVQSRRLWLSLPEGGSVLIQHINILHSIHFASNSLQLLSCKMITSHSRRELLVILLLMWAATFWQKRGQVTTTQ